MIEPRIDIPPATDREIEEFRSYATDPRLQSGFILGAADVRALLSRLDMAETALSVERRSAEALRKRLEESASHITSNIMALRGIGERDDVCSKCDATGVFCYGSTATWRRGVGGQMMTIDVCDACWGSGNRHRPWPSHRILEAMKTEASTAPS